MKKKILNTSLVLLFVGALALSGGCSKKTVTAPDAGQGKGVDGTTINYPPAEGYSENSLAQEGSLDDAPMGNLSLNRETEESDAYKRQYGRSSSQMKPIFFNFDQATIRQDMMPNMVLNADFLRANPSISVVIEGNCDERGTNEYNLALGERRALSAKEYLINLGIGSNRVRTVSYGEERPLFPGQDEDSLGMNRRDDFILE